MRCWRGGVLDHPEFLWTRVQIVLRIGGGLNRMFRGLEGRVWRRLTWMCGISSDRHECSPGYRGGSACDLMVRNAF